MTLRKYLNGRLIRKTTEVNGYIRVVFKDGRAPTSITVPVKEYKDGLRLERFKSPTAKETPS